MRRFRTMTRSGSRMSLCGCLLAVVLAGGGAPVSAEEKVAPTVPDQTTPDEVRGIVSSGLGEWGLSRRFPDSALWLDLEDEARTLALFWPETETPARGALIILADEGENAESGLAGALARELAHRKFAVLALGLEPPTAALEWILERPRPVPVAEPEEQSPDASSPATIDVMASEVVDELEAAYRARIHQELVAGAAELREREYELLAVIGIGRGSNHTVPYAVEQEPPSALIWVGPKFYPRDASRLAEALEKASLPRILELSSSDESGQRKADLERAGVESFSLQSVGSGTSFLPRNGKALAGRISAWLKVDARQQ
ncbi:DUF3530 family protein [Marinobacter sp.]|uniref:DUF3530 family protein n=1 Tax=Marinobacter sp. TaxID=50741 RepID=UPI003A8FA31C